MKRHISWRDRISKKETLRTSTRPLDSGPWSSGYSQAFLFHSQVHPFPFCTFVRNASQIFFCGLIVRDLSKAMRESSSSWNTGSWGNGLASFKRPGRIRNPYLPHQPTSPSPAALQWMLNSTWYFLPWWTLGNKVLFGFLKIPKSWISSHWPHLRISLFSSRLLGCINGKARILEGTYSLWEISQIRISPLIYQLWPPSV